MMKTSLDALSSFGNIILRLGMFKGGMFMGNVRPDRSARCPVGGGHLRRSALTVCNEVLGHMQSHLHREWTGHLTATHHGQHAGAHGNQRQGRLVHGAFQQT